MGAMGGPFWFSVLMSWFVLVEAARVAATVWLSVWTDSVDDGSLHGPFYFLSVYTIISGVQVCLRVFRGGFRVSRGGSVRVNTTGVGNFWPVIGGANGSHMLLLRLVCQSCEPTAICPDCHCGGRRRAALTSFSIHQYVVCCLRGRCPSCSSASSC